MKKIDLKTIVESLMLLVFLYLLIGGFSLLAVAGGEEIPYMPFWHYPWKFLFNLFD